QLKQYILPIVVISVVMTFLQPDVNITAHIAGLIVGMLIGFANFHPRNIARWQERQRNKRI
ncbi:MAG: rhomboid family intramembrane serine protease, partial [Kurthia sp.]